jgi:hypothetical protein
LDISLEEFQIIYQKIVRKLTWKWCLYFENDWRDEHEQVKNNAFSLAAARGAAAFDQSRATYLGMNQIGAKTKVMGFFFQFQLENSTNLK